MQESNLVQFIVPEEIKQARADKLLAQFFPEYSRTQIQRVFDNKEVFLQGMPIERKQAVNSGDELTFTKPEAKVTSLTPTDIPLDIIFEDEFIIAVNKAPGIVIHPGNATGDDTLVHALLHHTQGNLSMSSGELRPGVVHRLDKETSGIILFTKQDKAYLDLIKQFSSREVKKEYLALVLGCPGLEGGSIKVAIDRHPIHRVKMTVPPTGKGKEAHTDWAIEERIGKIAALVRCWLHTGRTHQIRVHLSHLVFPIMGDRQYGYNANRLKLPEAPRVLLHAEKISFTHPETQKKIELKAPLPQDFKDYLDLLRQHSSR